MELAGAPLTSCPPWGGAVFPPVVQTAPVRVSCYSPVTVQLGLGEAPGRCLGLWHVDSFLGFLVLQLGFRMGVAFHFVQFLEGALSGSASRQQFVAAGYQWASFSSLRWGQCLPPWILFCYRGCVGLFGVSES